MLIMPPDYQTERPLSQGVINLEFGMPLEKEVKRDFKAFKQEVKGLKKLITYFEELPLYEKNKSIALSEALPFPALYGYVGEQAIIIHEPLARDILNKFYDLNLEICHFSAFEISLLDKALSNLIEGDFKFSSDVNFILNRFFKEPCAFSSLLTPLKEPFLSLVGVKENEPLPVILNSREVCEEELIKLIQYGKIAFPKNDAKKVMLHTPFLPLPARLTLKNNSFHLEEIN